MLKVYNWNWIELDFLSFDVFHSKWINYLADIAIMEPNKDILVQHFSVFGQLVELSFR